MSMSALAVATATAAAAVASLVRASRRRLPPDTTLTSSAVHADAIAAMWHAAIKVGLLRPAIGLDVEWVRSNPAALLQLSVADTRGHTRTLCVRLCEWQRGDAVPQHVLALLQDPNVPKGGVGVTNDMRRVEAWAAQHGYPHLRTAGAVELVPLAERHGAAGKGLAALAAELLGMAVDKSKAIRCSDWEAPELTEAQVAYAAADARTSLRLLLKLRESAPAPASIVRPPTPAAHRRSSKPRRVNVPGRQRPMYDGWLMLDPHGLPMCRLAESRAHWYLSNGLAELAPPPADAIRPTAAAADERRCIRLLFTPNGPGNARDPWQLEAKANVCVGCGAAAGPHVRWSVLPHSFRRLLPHSMKSRDSHDIVLLCIGCYAQCERAYEGMRATLFAEHQIARDTSRLETVDTRHAKVQSAANALASHANRLPAARREYLEEMLLAALGLSIPAELTPSVLAEAARPSERRAREGYRSPEERLLESVARGGAEALHSFVTRWRELFIATLSPTHLPSGWAVHHRPRDPRDGGREAYRAQVAGLLQDQQHGSSISSRHDALVEELGRRPKCPLRARAAAEDARESETADSS